MRKMRTRPRSNGPGEIRGRSIARRRRCRVSLRFGKAKMSGLQGHPLLGGNYSNSSSCESIQHVDLPEGPWVFRSRICARVEMPPDTPTLRKTFTHSRGRMIWQPFFTSAPLAQGLRYSSCSLLPSSCSRCAFLERPLRHSSESAPSSSIPRHSFHFPRPKARTGIFRLCRGSLPALGAALGPFSFWISGNLKSGFIYFLCTRCPSIRSFAAMCWFHYSRGAGENKASESPPFLNYRKFNPSSCPSVDTTKL